jgi:hypothetical protein
MPRRARGRMFFKAFSCTASGGLLVTGAVLLAAGLAGCGTASGTPSSSSNQVAVRVGAVTILRSEVEHWAAAIGRSKSVATSLGTMSGTPRDKALEFLISSSWTIGEAEAQRLRISNGDIERGLQEKINAAPNGRSEFREELASTGQTLADVKLEVESTLAVARLREAVAKRVPPLTRGEVTGYYARHRGSFYLPDRRVVDLIEQIPGYGHAVFLGKQLGPGARFARRAIRELVRREPPAEAADRMNGQLVRMIFATTPGRVSAPAMFNGRWVIAVVRNLIPAGIQLLSAVRGELSKQLAAQRTQQALKRFSAAFVRRWTARTSCSPGFVVQKCTQYRGGVAQASPLVDG